MSLTFQIRFTTDNPSPWPGSSYEGVNSFKVTSFSWSDPEIRGASLSFDKLSRRLVVTMKMPDYFPDVCSNFEFGIPLAVSLSENN